MNIVDRFIAYAKMETTSDPMSTSIPSTASQLELAKVLEEQLNAFGLLDVYTSEYGVVYATLEKNVEHDVDCIGLIAHMDTSSDMSGKHVHPRLITNYDGSTIVLNEKEQITMDPKMFPSLERCIGKDLLVTDGTTLLGADDKAGISIIMDLIQYYVEHPDVKHPTIKVIFTPDEEIGHGADHVDVKKVDADYAYTIDGAEINVISFENFNAASAKVHVQGNSIHPGSAKDKLLNASKLAMEFHMALPLDLDPAKTEGYEGFNHLTLFNGQSEYATLEYIIRNHSREKFEAQKQDFYAIQDAMNATYGKNTIKVDIEDSYYNMAELFKDHMYIVDDVRMVMQDMGIPVHYEPIRGGTDGARLSNEGLLTPNLGTGGDNFHGKYEYLCIDEMKQMVEILKNVMTSKVENI
ncbi:tripeptide aminopeptidase [Breznakia blatticola]|uniref:Peptidase T n=1 Tax=Breznakia blatticola TaxID=1754012 RepID=A0A4R7ZF03_9FIRM|nr:peptidase T [Breznakia blatticola]TDW16179.1 tripeptide aminopeptidase [Breznakia blatticola]